MTGERSPRSGPGCCSFRLERSWGAHPYFVPVEHTTSARETLGSGPMLAPEQAVVLETDPDKARAIAREHTTGYLMLTNYTNNLRRFGFTDEDLSGGGSDRLVDAIVAWGDEEAIAERVATTGPRAPTTSRLQLLTARRSVTFAAGALSPHCGSRSVGRLDAGIGPSPAVSRRARQAPRRTRRPRGVRHQPGLGVRAQPEIGEVQPQRADRGEINRFVRFSALPTSCRSQACTNSGEAADNRLTRHFQAGSARCLDIPAPQLGHHVVDGSAPGPASPPARPGA